MNVPVYRNDNMVYRAIRRIMSTSITSLLLSCCFLALFVTQEPSVKLLKVSADLNNDFLHTGLDAAALFSLHLFFFGAFLY